MPTTPGPSLVVTGKVPKPQREVIEIHTTRERRRQADGGALGKDDGLMLFGGALAGGAATVLVAEKLGASPVMAGAGTAAAAMLLKDKGQQQIARAAALGAGGLVGVQLVAGWMAKRNQAQAAAQADKGDKKKRGADADQPITRQELNDALTLIAEKNAAQQKQQTCDLVSVLRDEVRRVVVEMLPAANHPAARPPTPSTLPFPMQYVTRGANVDAEERNARVEDDYMRSAYGEGERNAYADDGERNAQPAEDQRNAQLDEDERNAHVEEYAEAA